MGPYRPRQWNEIEDGPVSMINEPIVANAVPLRPVQNARPIHAVLIETLASTRSLLQRLETGVSVPSHGREIVRRLYVTTRQQRDALVAALQIGDLE